MKRIPVGLTDEQHARLKSEAARRRRSVGALIREAVDDAYPEESLVRRQAHARALQAIGKFHSGKSDIADQHDDYLAELDRW